MAQETRTTDIFGPKLVIETGNPQMGSAGRTAFTMQSTTDEGIRFIQSHSESGMSKIMSEGMLQVETGASSLVNEDQTTFQFIAHKGDFAVNADKGHVKISGKQIVLEASLEVVIQAPRIRIGYEQEHKTKDIKILGQSVDIKCQKGNMADVLGTSSFLKTFQGTFVTDLALAASKSPIAGGVADIVTGESNILGISFGV
jgi:hypothetical protein|tara:strand:+ start:55 stop:654 length:600 start_codon:yes stop_codon:yes gene_type:complete